MSITLFKKVAVSAVAVAGLALSLVVVGCGGDDDDNNSGNNGNGDCTQGVNCPGDNPGGGGTFKDSRDGQTYKQVTIGSQTWMAENLNYETSDSWCYDDDPSNCATYGRLYTWDAAVSACPAGWHLPSNAEWGVLVDYVNTSTTSSNNAGSKLRSQTGWSGNGNVTTDEYGFSALPGGAYRDGKFILVGYVVNWWSATEFGAPLADYRIVQYDSDHVSSLPISKTYAFSVRCTRN